jgi:hypothetical protein
MDSKGRVTVLASPTAGIVRGRRRLSQGPPPAARDDGHSSGPGARAERPGAHRGTGCGGSEASSVTVTATVTVDNETSQQII